MSIKLKNDQRYKERIEHSHDRPTLTVAENVNVRRKEVLDILFMQREERHAQDQTRKLGPSIGTDDKCKLPKENNIYYKNDQRSKERIELQHTNDGPPLHNNGNASFRRKEVSDIPFMGRQEKRDHKHEIYLSKPRPESDSNNNGIRKPEVKEDDVKSTEEKEPVRLLKPCYNTPLPPPSYTKPNTPNHHHRPSSSDDLLPPNSGRKKKDQNNIPLPKPRSSNLEYEAMEKMFSEVSNMRRN